MTDWPHARISAVLAILMKYRAVKSQHADGVLAVLQRSPECSPGRGLISVIPMPAQK